MNNFKNTNWMKVFSREVGVYYGEMILLAMSNEKLLKNPIKNHLVIPDDTYQAYVVDKDEFLGPIKEIKEKIKTKERYFEFKKDALNKAEEFSKFSKSLSNKVSDNISDQKLYDLFLKFNGLWRDYSILMSWTPFILNKAISEEIEKIINSKIEKTDPKFSFFLSSALKPANKSSILSLKEKVLKIDKSDKDELLDVFKEFKWFTCLDVINDPWQQEDFFEFVDNIKESEKESTKEYLSIKEIKNKLNLNSKEVSRIQLAQDIVYLKDLRDDYRRKSIYFAIPLFKEISKRMNLNRKDVGMLTSTEMKDWLINKTTIPQKKIDLRKDSFVVYEKDNNFVCIEGDEIKTFLKNINFSLNEKSSKKIKGIVANKSDQNITSKVKVIKSKKDLSKINKGDILVAVTTHPEYVTAMSKSSAFITDEGGLTSHAAIVSREMNKSCIVGTGNATKILKDGDKVEVNANEGIVKIIEKA